MKTKADISILIEQRPNYYRGQLLLEDDFIAEQQYHLNARRRHNIHLHGWGVVQGLKVSCKSANSIQISPGLAVDASGREIFIDESQLLSISGFEPNELVVVHLRHIDQPVSSNSEINAPQNRQSSHALIQASVTDKKGDALTLVRIQLNENCEIDENSIDYSKTNYLRAVAPESITLKELHPELRKGWIRMPFRPIPLVNKPKNEPEIPPGFRVGATESISKSHGDRGEMDKGAAGTMAIPVPPNAVSVTQLRLAGSQNKEKILFELIKGGWDTVRKEHVREIVLKETITSTPDHDWFEKTFPANKILLDPEYNTLSLWLRGTGKTKISLIAVEFAY